jgi:hypothetical protein
MPTKEQLREQAVALSDEALLDRLRSGGLTELAEEVTRGELAGRGIDVESALSEPPPVPPRPAADAAAIAVASGRPLLRRVLRFPLRAALGVEPLWAVFLVGAAAAFAVWKAVIWGIFQLLSLRPLPPFALPGAYAALGIFALYFAWWGIALWRSGDRETSVAWTILARTAAVVCGTTATVGTLNAARVVQEFVLR